jgi:nitrile hydratase
MEFAPMPNQAASPNPELRPLIVAAEGELPEFAAGDRVRVLTRSPIGHYRLPIYLRGKIGVIETVIQRMAVDNEDEGFGRNAGSKGHYYRVAFRMLDVWPEYLGAASDGLCIEIFQSWLEKA